MTRAEIASMIAGVGLPYAYDHFTPDDTPGAPPFITFIYPADADFKADDVNYQRGTDLTIEFYTDEPDFTKEAAIETALNSAGLVYSRSGPIYIRDERMYQTTYETSVLLDEAPPAETGNETSNTEVLDTDAEQG